MNIAELFVNLGIKGSEKTVGALSNVRKGLGEVTSMSIEAKAAILAAAYGFERLMSASGMVGVGLTNFNALTGISAQRLQEYQYAARQAGVSNEEMAGSLKALQSSMSAVARGEGAPAGMKFISGLVGGFDVSKLQDVDYMMKKLQDFASNPNVSAAQKRWALSTFGQGEGVVAAMNLGKFSPDIMKNAPKYSGSEIASLNQAQIAWSNLGQKVEMAFGHFNAKHGAQLVSDLSKIVTQVVKLADAFQKLSEKLHFFQGIAKIFEGWTAIFSTVNKTVSNVGSNKGGVVSGALKEGSEIKEGIGLAFKGFMETIFEAISPKGSQGVSENDYFIPPKVQPSFDKNSSQNVNVNQTMNFQHEGKDAKKTADSVKKAVSDAYRQIQAQVQGS